MKTQIQLFLNQRLASLLVVMVFLVASINVANAQAVANPGFETRTACPGAVAQMFRCSSWAQPTSGTSDYFVGTGCGFLPSSVGIPGAITAQSGNAFIGLFAEQGTSDYKEYVTNTLSTPLTAGVTYNISFYIRGVIGGPTNSGPANGFRDFTFRDLAPAERGFFGLMFSTTAPTTANTSNGQSSILNNFPSTGQGGKVFIPAASTVYTNHAWTQVTLRYTATGGEQFMTVGQFREGLTASNQYFDAYYFMLDGFSDAIACNAGTAQVSLNASTATIPCSATSVDLNTFVTGTPPTGTVVRWYTTADHSTPVLTTTQVANATAGTYYAFFYDSVANCFNTDASTAQVVVSNAVCTDLTIHKMGTASVTPNATTSYRLLVSNNGPSNVTNVVVQDPAVANFTATGITATAGPGSGSSATVPVTLTVAALQGSGLVIPSLPAGSTITFEVTGTAGASGSIVNTATVTAPVSVTDSNTSNNTSTYTTTIANCTTTTTYTFDAAATFSGLGAASATGGTVNLIYSLSSGTAIPSFGSSISIPMTYSDFKQDFAGSDHRWAAFVQFSASVLSLVPDEQSWYVNLPSKNTSSKAGTTPSSVDNFFATRIADPSAGGLLQLGTFDITYGAVPTAPGARLISESISTISVNNNAGPGVINGGWWMRPMDQPISNPANANANGVALSVVLGNKYTYRYSALSSGGSLPDEAINRGLRFNGGTLVYCTECAAGTAQVALTSTTLSACSPSTVNLNTAFTGTAPTGSSLVWFTTADRSTPVLTNAQAMAAGAGTYYAFFYDSVLNCFNTATSTSSVVVTINATPANPGTITGPTCVPAPATGQIYSVPAVPGATTYTWTYTGSYGSSSSGIVSGIGTNSITVAFGSNATSGNFNVTITTPCGTSAASTLAVTVLPQPSVTSLGESVICTVGGSTLLTSTPAPEYQWYLDGVILAGETNQNYTATAAGDYTVVTSSGSCTSDTSLPFTVIVEDNTAPVFVSPLGTTQKSVIIGFQNLPAGSVSLPQVYNNTNANALAAEKITIRQSTPGAQVTRLPLTVYPSTADANRPAAYGTSNALHILNTADPIRNLIVSFPANASNVKLSILDIDGNSTTNPLQGQLNLRAYENGVLKPITINPLFSGNPIPVVKAYPDVSPSTTPTIIHATGGRGLTSVVELRRAGVNVDIPGPVNSFVVASVTRFNADANILFSDISYDYTAPILPADVTVNCDAIPAPVVLTANDNCGLASVIYTQVPAIYTPSTSTQIITRTWEATDTAGNTTIHTQTITVNPASAAPTAAANQSICATVHSSLANIAITGTDIKWYADATTSTQLPITTLLVNGTIYYATQTLAGNCESARVAVTVELKNCARINPNLRVRSSK